MKNLQQFDNVFTQMRSKIGWCRMSKFALYQSACVKVPMPMTVCLEGKLGKGIAAGQCDCIYVDFCLSKTFHKNLRLEL